MKLQWPFRYVGLVRRDDERAARVHVSQVINEIRAKHAAELAEIVHRELIRKGRTDSVRFG